MIRRAAAVVVVAVCMCVPSATFATSLQGASAQSDVVFTVDVPSADVYKGPTTASAVIGRAPRGSVLTVTRELGSWVKISWPDAKDGIGYVHVSKGLIGRRASTESGRQVSARTSSSSPAARSGSPATQAVPSAGVGIRTQPAAPVSSVYVTPSTHIFGIGARLGGPSLGFGATARAWRHDRLGVQFEVSRYAPSDSLAPESVTSLQFEPSAIYALRDHVSDNFWLRPYVGTGINFSHQTWNPAPGAATSLSDNKVGGQIFGGAEVTFPSLPKLAVSADLGYHWTPNAFPGVSLGGFGLSLAGHWYIK
jgi:hypothetical protein